MQEYTNLVAEQIANGRIMKAHSGSNSMYETETHFEPIEKEYEALLVALERANNKRDLGFGRTWSIDVFNLVVKQVKHSFDEGDIISKQLVIRFETEKYDEKRRRKHFYVTDLKLAQEISAKRDLRASQMWRENPVAELKATPEFTDKLRGIKGFKNAKAKKLLVMRNKKSYIIINTALKTRPEHIVRL